MGAVFVSMTLDGALTREQVKSAFEAEQRRDRHENGHSYSGGFGMADGIAFSKVTFNNADIAYRTVADSTDKWGPAEACRFKESDGSERWFIGAWCAE